jgi:hypothetical protein
VALVHRSLLDSAVLRDRGAVGVAPGVIGGSARAVFPRAERCCPDWCFFVSDCHAILTFIDRSSVLTSECGDPESGEVEIPRAGFLLGVVCDELAWLIEYQTRREGAGELSGEDGMRSDRGGICRA